MLKLCCFESTCSNLESEMQRLEATEYRQTYLGLFVVPRTARKNINKWLQLMIKSGHWSWKFQPIDGTKKFLKKFRVSFALQLFAFRKEYCCCFYSSTLSKFILERYFIQVFRHLHVPVCLAMSSNQANLERKYSWWRNFFKFHPDMNDRLSFGYPWNFGSHGSDLVKTIVSKSWDN